MDKVGAHEAKTRLAELLGRVEKGERIAIIRDGMPVAILGPAPEQSTQSLEEIIDALREFRRGRALDGLSLRELIEQGRQQAPAA